MLGRMHEITRVLSEVRSGKAGAADLLPLVSAELLAADAELTEARIKLAEAEQNADTVIELLEELVAQRQEERDLVAERVKAGTDAPAVLAAAAARLADAKARLAKVK
jgi:hypothetical protein